MTGQIRRFLNLFRRERISRDLAREFDFHIAERTDDLTARGLDPRAAERQARRQFGAYAMHKEDTWMTDILGWLETLLADLRYALRGLRSSPVFAAVAIVSLALGIGANTAIFTLIDAVMLRALPVTHPEELVQVQNTRNGAFFTNPMWEQLRDRLPHDVLSGVFSWGVDRFNVNPGGESRLIAGNWVSGDYFPALGVEPALGRLLTPADDRRGCPAAAVLSHNFWQREHGGSPGVVGKSILLEGHPFEIAGVSRAGFTGLDVGASPDVFIPICSEPFIRIGGQHTSALDQRDDWWLRVMGRRKAEISVDQVQSRLQTLAPGIFEATVPPDLRPEQEKEYRESRFTVNPAPNGLSRTRRLYGDALWILMAGVGLVLLIACANVANLLLARSMARQREVAVRAALGAGRFRLIRQTLTESLLLSAIGALLGMFIAGWGSRTLAALISTTRNPVALDLAPDARILLFTAIAGIVTGVLFGLVPAWRSSTVSPNGAMKAQGRGLTEGHSRMRMNKFLVVAQVALSMILVAGAGLMVRSFWNLRVLDPGFRADGVLVVTVNMGHTNLSNAQQERLREGIFDRLHGIPGVRSACLSKYTPASGGGWADRITINPDVAVPRSSNPSVYFNAVSEGYFETMGTPILAGRDFTNRDSPGAPRAAIVNQALVERFFGKSNPLGRTFRMNMGRDWGPPLEIVGVVGNAKYWDLREPIRATAYVPIRQRESETATFNAELRVAGSLATVLPAIKEAVSAANPNVTLQVFPLTQQIAESMTQEKMLATLSSFFGGLALLLAAIGLYGVISYNVVRRRNEIGIRMALGAAQARVLRMVLGEAGWLAGVGLGLGIAGTLAATQLVAAFLYGLQPDDPATLAGAAATLAVVAGLAAYLPARRAAKLDPMTALRDE